MSAFSTTSALGGNLFATDSLHDLNIAAHFADAVMVMRQGRVVCCGRPDEVIEEGMIASVFGVEVALSSALDGRLIVTPMRTL